jgi:hypothetical protein
MTDNQRVLSLIKMLTAFDAKKEQAHALWDALDDPSWLKRESGGDLRGINLWNTYLPGIDLSGCDLRGAKFDYAVLNGANLSGADLEDADLENAKLIGANLNGANLQHAELEGTNLTGADVRGANMWYSNPWCAIGLPIHAQHDVNTLWADNFVNLRAGPDEAGYYTRGFDKFHKWKDHIKRTGWYETEWPYHAIKKPEWIK